MTIETLLEDADPRTRATALAFVKPIVEVILLPTVRINGARIRMTWWRQWYMGDPRHHDEPLFDLLFDRRKIALRLTDYYSDFRLRPSRAVVIHVHEEFELDARRWCSRRFPRNDFRTVDTNVVGSFMFFRRAEDAMMVRMRFGT